ncbi:MAG: thiamine pyrophosphate-dependent enzyme [Bacteroidota bacterium]
MTSIAHTNPTINTEKFDKEAVLHDYYIGRLSRELSNFIRRDVMTGRAKFGVSDDGKELFQLAQAKAIQPGDWRADYYRGHTLLLATGQATVEGLLAQLYADAANDPFSKGRQMNNHHATPINDLEGNWLNHLEQFNVSSATSPTAGQMARGLGLAFASRVYRQAEQLGENTFSNKGNEISWTSIGDASTSEGVFWETLNAAGVLQVPMAVTVADDGYGISVPVEYQTTKGSISAAMAGLQANPGTNGIDIYQVKGWDYPALVQLYTMAAEKIRKEHRAALIHVYQLTQPNGHSTSGSHERYKDAARMKFEQEYDCLRQFRLWMLGTGIAEAEELVEIEQRAKQEVKVGRQRAWENFTAPLKARKAAVIALLETYTGANAEVVSKAIAHLQKQQHPVVSEVIDLLRRTLLQLPVGAFATLEQYIKREQQQLSDLMGRHLYSETLQSPLRVSSVPAHFNDEAQEKNGYEILQHYFKAKFAEVDTLYAFGEDVGKIGDVNQGFAGVQELFGEHRIFDTGIREWSIAGQAMGMSMRGLRPIVEIQYLDYVYYALPLLTDDVATLRWRTAGMQACPMIIRSRGHRLEGIWHSGSYLSPLIGSMRGMHLCVPRNMVQAAGMYNTLLEGDDPAMVIEVLNGYRLKELEPSNLTDFRVPLGVPEVLREGADLTIVTYGACVRICLEAAELLTSQQVEVEIIDIQTLLPFDVEHRIAERLQHTNRLLIVDEDTPGGASAYILQQITEQQGGFLQLDAPVKTLTAKAHRPAYADDGNYTSKPQVMDVVDAALEVVMF